MTSNSQWRLRTPTRATTAPSRQLKTIASPAIRAASLCLASPYRRAATAVRPTPTISASETIIQIQNIEVETAASPAGPIRVPTQNASTDANSVISTDDATAGSATLMIVVLREAPTTRAPPA